MQTRASIGKIVLFRKNRAKPFTERKIHGEGDLSTVSEHGTEPPCHVIFSTFTCLLQWLENSEKHAIKTLILIFGMEQKTVLVRCQSVA